VKQAVDRYSAQPPQVRRLQMGGAAVVAIALVALLVPGEETPAANAPGLTSEVPANGAATTPPPAPETQPTAMDKMVKAAADVVQKAAPKLRPAPAFPPELATDVKIMLDAESSRDRRSAAEKVLAYQPPNRISPHLRVIAELERARGCKTRKEVIATMQLEADLRYLPPLQRLARSPRSGCGFLNLADCLSCIRGDLREAIDEIEKKLPQPGSSEQAPSP
jgi:serine/threonine-protein kinase